MNHFNGMFMDFSHWGQPLKMMSRAAQPPPRDSARRWPGPCPLCFPNLATVFRVRNPGESMVLFGCLVTRNTHRFWGGKEWSEHLEKGVSMKSVSLGDTSMNIFHYSARWAKTRLHLGTHVLFIMKLVAPRKT